MCRDFERDILPMCGKFGLAIAPFGALGGGRLHSKKEVSCFNPVAGATVAKAPVQQIEERKSAGESIRTLVGGPELTAKEEKFSEVLEKIGAPHGLGVTGVALACSSTPF